MVRQFHHSRKTWGTGVNTPFFALILRLDAIAAPAAPGADIGSRYRPHAFHFFLFAVAFKSEASPA